jgi:hypothetical protein
MENLKKFLPKTFGGWFNIALIAMGILMTLKGHPEGALPAMAFLDAQNLFSGSDVSGVLTGQAVALGAGTASTNIIDQLAARVLGAGRVPDLLVQFTTTAGAVTQIQALLVGADDAAFAVNKVTLADTGQSVAMANGTSGFLRAAIKVTKPKRFLRVEWTLVGAASAANVIAGLIDQEQTTPETIS